MNTQSTLLDHLHTLLKGKQNDAKLSMRLGVQAPVISKIRGDTLKIGATFILAVHEEFDITTAEIRELAGLQPAYVRGG